MSGFPLAALKYLTIIANYEYNIDVCCQANENLDYLLLQPSTILWEVRVILEKLCWSNDVADLKDCPGFYIRMGLSKSYIRTPLSRQW
jgi:hypothetical protein